MPTPVNEKVKEWQSADGTVRYQPASSKGEYLWEIFIYADWDRFWSTTHHTLAELPNNVRPVLFRSKARALRVARRWENRRRKSDFTPSSSAP